MRYIVANCYDTRDHLIHVSDPRPSMHQCVDGLEIRICPGGRVGDRRIREADDIAELAEMVRVEQVARNLAAILTGDAPAPQSSGGGLSDAVDEPDEPDYDEDYEADRAADRYERWLDSLGG